MKFQKCNCVCNSVAFSWLGMIGVATFIIMWVCAASVDTAWQFGVNTLSEFGISDTAASLYFNYGCIFTGIFLAIFGIGRAICIKNTGHAVGGIMFIIGGLFLALVGVFTMDSGDMHYFVAATAALCLLFGMGAITYGNWASGRKIFAAAGIILIFLAVTAAFAFDIAGFEAYGIIAALIWFLTESVNMILSGRKN